MSKFQKIAREGMIEKKPTNKATNKEIINGDGVMLKLDSANSNLHVEDIYGQIKTVVQIHAKSTLKSEQLALLS